MHTIGQDTTQKKIVVSTALRKAQELRPFPQISSIAKAALDNTSAKVVKGVQRNTAACEEFKKLSQMSGTPMGDGSKTISCLEYCIQKQAGVTPEECVLLAVVLDFECGMT